MGAMTRLQIEELANRHEGDPEWFLAVCADISNGDSLDKAYAKLCEQYAVSWGAFRNWVSVDPKREAQYQAAIAARTELRKEKVSANVTDIATVRHGSEVKASDTLRAAEIVLDSGVTEKGVAVAVTIIHESA